MAGYVDCQHELKKQGKTKNKKQKGGLRVKSCLGTCNTEKRRRKGKR